VLGPDHRETLKSRYSLEWMYDTAGRAAERIELNEEALRLCTAKLGADDAFTLAHGSQLARAYWAAGRTAEGIKLLERILPLATVKLGPRHPNVISSRFVLAEAYFDSGQSARSEPHYRELTRLLAAKLGDLSQRDHRIVALFRLSMIDVKSGRLDQAETEARQALALTGQMIDENPSLATLPPQMTLLARFGSSHRDLARVLEAQGRIPEAVALYEKAISIIAEAVQKEPRDQFAPQWLADVQRARDKARTKLARSDTSRDVSMPNGARAFAP
jgi:tetratricopeptide (TPR) repeat protein